MFGSILIIIAFSAALISCGAYVFVVRGREDFRAAARVALHVSTVSLLVAAAFFLRLILTHQFQYSYVFHYTSRDLSLPLLISTFYVGQEGSFLLWTLYISIFGIILVKYIARERYEAEVMWVFMLVETFLLLMIVVKTPFTMVWDAFPGQFAKGFVPQDGQGLNPTLQNLWIIIHPPILFAGFSLMTLPFCFAIAGLVKRDYQGWIRVAMPWALAASMTLGCALMLGGFWAYETLGWGGFWGWDPVENSSLIPWLVCVALVHTMLTQRRTGGLVKTNLVLGILTFILVLYSTFLTRSGVLGDLSVHSFVDPGFFAYLLLIIFMVVFMGVGIGALVWRSKEIVKLSKEYHVMSREIALSIGSALLLACALVVIGGTSWPIFSKSAVATEFYATMNLPIAIALVLVNGLSMMLKWKMTGRGEFFKKILPVVAISVALTIATFFLGVHDTGLLALAFGCFLALSVNCEIGWLVVRGNPGFIGAYVSHCGVALFLLGVIATSHYSEKAVVELPQGETREALGYEMKYTGTSVVEETDHLKYNIEISRDGATHVISPVMYNSTFFGKEQTMRTPGIKNLWVRDVYIEPTDLRVEGGAPVFTVKKGESVSIVNNEGVLKFDGFDFNGMQKSAMMSGQDFRIGAECDVTYKGKTTHVTTYTKYINGDFSQPSYEPAIVPGTSIIVALSGMQVDRANLANSQAVLAAYDQARAPAPQKEIIVVEVSTKPLILLVWTGVMVMVLGFAFAIRRRLAEVNRSHGKRTHSVPQDESRGPVHNDVPQVKKKTSAPSA